MSASPSLSPLPEDNDSPAATAPVTDLTVNMNNADLSDNDSVLSDVDEAQFEDFDPANIAIDERPIAVDEQNVKLLGRHKRKKDGEVDGEKPKKRKEGKREKPKKSRKKRDVDDNFSGGEELEGKRTRKNKAFTEDGDRAERPRQRKAATPENEEELDPAELAESGRRRALDRAMDAALKNPNRRRRRADGIDVSSKIDDEIADLRQRMANAAELDVKARSEDPPRPAVHKLLLLPQVTALLNRNSREVENAIVDPENNLLESVRFFLEPLNDGSMPAYDIQRDLFACLTKLTIGKDALIASGIGKVVLFYTKSSRPERSIKRQAHRLVAEWSRPILKRSDDYRKRVLQEADYDPTMVKQTRTQTPGVKAAETSAQIRARLLAPPLRQPNRARVETGVTSYSIVPKSNVQGGGAYARPMGASGEEAFRKIQARQQATQGKGPRR